MSPAAVPYCLHDCAPDLDQRHLLTVLTAPPEESCQAWRDWCRAGSLDDVDSASYRLLPLAYRRLSAFGVDDPVLARLKGVYRHTWIKNQTQFRAVEELIDALGDIPVLILKGAALTARVYGDAGVRAMQDVDLMVPRDDFARALHTLTDAGWSSSLGSEKRTNWHVGSRFIHACGLDRRGVEVDLHADLLRFMPVATEAAWESAERWQWRGREVYRLSDTLQLFQLCVHGTRWSHAYLQWIVDAWMLLRHAETVIDWDALLATAQATRTTRSLANALAYLRDQLALPVPGELIDALHGTEVTAAEDREFQFMARRDWHVHSLRGIARRALYLSPRFGAALRGDTRPLAPSPAGWLRYYYVPLRGLLAPPQSMPGTPPPRA